MEKKENELLAAKASEVKLKADMKEQEDMFLERQEKFNLAGNPDYEAILKHENTMFKKVEDKADSVTTSK